MPVAVIYMGAASPEESECPQAVKEALGDEFETIYAGDETDLSITEALEQHNPSVFIQPGGGDDMEPAWAAVGPHADALRQWISNGGAYVGICMGSFLSGKGEEGEGFDGFDLLSEAGWTAQDYKAMPGIEGNEKELGLGEDGMGQTCLNINWRGDDRQIFFQGGPIFIPVDGVENPSVIEKLATFNVGNEGGFPSNAAAAIVIKYGNGAVGVTGPHPEATASWYTDADKASGCGLNEPTHDLFLDLVKTTIANSANGAAGE